MLSGKERDRLKVLHEVQGGHLTQGEAAGQLGISDREVRTLAGADEEDGDKGVVHRLRGKASNRRLAESLRTRVLKLVKAKYRDFGPTLACEYLAKENGVDGEQGDAAAVADGCGIAAGEAAARSRRCTCGGRAGVVGESWCNGTPRCTTGWKGGGRGCTWWR